MGRGINSIPWARGLLLASADRPVHIPRAPPRQGDLVGRSAPGSKCAAEIVRKHEDINTYILSEIHVVLKALMGYKI